jgi:hypothetical protein
MVVAGCHGAAGGSCYGVWMGVWGERVYDKKPHQVKLFFPIFYFLGPDLRIRNFFLESRIIPEAFLIGFPNISLRIF